MLLLGVGGRALVLMVGVVVGMARRPCVVGGRGEALLCGCWTWRRALMLVAGVGGVGGGRRGLS